MNYPWFRMYSEAVDDDKLGLLAFEDRWHFVALLCLKSAGTLDSGAPLLERRVAKKLGLQVNQLEEVKRRLMEVGLIDENFQPLAWGRRQFKSDHDAAERKRRQRQRDSHNDVTTSDRDCPTLDSESDTESESEGRAQPPVADATKEAASPPKRKAKPRKHPIPEDFDLNDERKAYAEKHLPAVDAAALMAVFRSTSKAKGWTYADWDQHWQTLVRQWAPDSGHWSSGQYPRKNNGRQKMADGSEVRW